MSGCIKDLYDYDLVEKFNNCKNISLKYNLYKNKTEIDGLNSEWVFCCKE